jgi:hypothetical protein
MTHPLLTSQPIALDGALNNLFGKGLLESEATSLYDITIMLAAGIPLSNKDKYPWQVSA